MSFAKKLQLLKAQNEEGKHLSPDWQPKETDDKPTGASSPEVPSESGARGGGGGGAKALFKRGTNAIKLKPTSKSALSIINDAKSGDANEDFSAGLGGDGPSHFSPFLSSMSPVVDEVTVDPPSDDDDMGVAPLPGSKGATANATSVDSKTPPKRQSLYGPGGGKSSGMLRRSDVKFKEIKREMARRARAKKMDTGKVQEYYVDSHRMASVQLSSESGGDLKKAMAKHGMKGFNAALHLPGQPNDVLYVKYAEHHLKKFQYDKALYCINVALEMNKFSLDATLTKAKCNAQLGNWKPALRAAEEVLMADPINYRGLQIKAEGLFNLCFFEHALVLFHRGRFLYPESEEFRLGIQKSRETIRAGVEKAEIFLGGGVEAMFTMMRQLAELRNMDKIGMMNRVTGPKMSIARLSSHLRAKKDRDVEEAQKHQKDLESGAAADKNDDDEEEANIPKPKEFSPQKLAAPVIKEDFSTINLSAVPGSSDILATGGREGDSQTQPLAAPNKTSSTSATGRKQRVKFADTKKGKTSYKAAQFQDIFDAGGSKSKGKQKKPNINLGKDRMLEDKIYLEMLTQTVTKIGGGVVNDHENRSKGADDGVRSAALDALDFLRCREDFWEQVEIGNATKDQQPEQQVSKKPKQALQSTRLNYIM